MSPRKFTLDFYAEARKLALGYLSKVLFGVAEDVIARIADEMAAEMESVLRGAVGRARAGKKSDIDASRARIVRACKALSIPPPRPGQMLDMRKALSQKRKIARACHPDLNPGTGASEQLQQAVMAYALLTEVYGTPQRRHGGRL